MNENITEALDKVERKIWTYMGHKNLSKLQNFRINEIDKVVNEEPETCSLLIMDYKIKTEPIRFRET